MVQNHRLNVKALPEVSTQLFIHNYRFVGFEVISTSSFMMYHTFGHSQALTAFFFENISTTVFSFSQAHTGFPYPEWALLASLPMSSCLPFAPFPRSET